MTARISPPAAVQGAGSLLSGDVAASGVSSTPNSTPAVSPPAAGVLFRMVAMPVSRCDRCRDAFFGMHAGLCLRCDALVAYTEAQGRARQAEAARKAQLERWARVERTKLRRERARRRAERAAEALA